MAISKDLKEQSATAQVTLKVCMMPHGPGVANNTELLTTTVRGLIQAIDREDKREAQRAALPSVEAACAVVLAQLDHDAGVET